MKALVNLFELKSHAVRKAATMAIACAVGLFIVGDIASAQSGSTRRRGGGSDGGTTTGGATTTTGSSVDYETPYTPSELDHPIDEFLMGRTTWTQPQGAAELSFGGSFVPSGSTRSSELRARGEYGLTNELELHAEVPMSLTDQAGTVQAQSAFSSVQLGAAYALAPMNNPMALTAEFDVQVPIGSNASADQTLFKPALIAAYDFGATEIHGDVQAVLGGTWRGLNADASLAHSLGAVVPTLEFSARTAENSRPQMYLTPGVYYNFSNTLEAGIGVPVGLNDISQTGIAARINVQLGR